MLCVFIIMKQKVIHNSKTNELSLSLCRSNLGSTPMEESDFRNPLRYPALLIRAMLTPSYSKSVEIKSPFQSRSPADLALGPVCVRCIWKTEMSLPLLQEGKADKVVSKSLSLILKVKVSMYVCIMYIKVTSKISNDPRLRVQLVKKKDNS